MSPRMADLPLEPLRFAPTSSRHLQRNSPACRHYARRPLTFKGPSFPPPGAIPAKTPLTRRRSDPRQDVLDGPLGGDRVQLPGLAVLDRAARFERLEGSERFHFEHVPIRERLVV